MAEKKRQRKGSQKYYQNIIIIIHSIHPNKPWVEYFLFRNTNILSLEKKP